MHENRETSETPAVQPGCRTAGEGLGRTARADVLEESHDGIVPMNHSNKDKRPLAENEEGRGAVDNAVDLARCESLRRQLPVRTASMSGACGGNEARSARM
jgi:hypothetical protein